MRSSSGEHFLALDHVRALAAFMVFSWHFCHQSEGLPVSFASAPAIFPLALLDEGHTGVALFMTLSGYLFAKLLHRNDFTFSLFLWNRFVRLAPLMILILIIVGVKEIYRGAATIELIRRYIISIFSIGSPSGPLPNGLWSIMVEWHFYLILPLLLAAFQRFGLATAVVIIVVSTSMRSIFYIEFGEVQSLAYWTLIGRIDQFVLGIAAFRYSGMIKDKHMIAAATTIGFTAYYWLFDRSGGFYMMPRYPSSSLVWIIMPAVEGLAYGLLISYYDRTFVPRNTGISWVVGLIGAYSYSIYVLHFFFISPAAEFIYYHIMDITNIYVAEAWSLLCFLLMLPVGHLSFRFIESPFLRFRKRYMQTSAEITVCSPQKIV